MTWLDNPDRLVVQRRLIAMNLCAVIMNLTIVFLTMRWMALANIAAAAFSGWMAWKLYKRMPEIKREQEQRILTILKGH